MESNGPQATLIGDIIGSKKRADRVALQRSLADALASVNRILDPVQPLEPTLGDEFQGVFPEIGQAVRASLLLQLELHKRGEINSRYGLGWGNISIFELSTPVSQDGPGWWAARGAIEQVKEEEGKRGTKFVRSRFSRAEDGESSSRINAATLNAFLICRDGIVNEMDSTAKRRLLGLLLGKTQREIAAEEGTTQSAISQSLKNNAAYAIEAAERELLGAPG